MPETIKPEDVKIGDRVRITVEGVRRPYGGPGDLLIKLTGGTCLYRAELAHATIERIPEVIEEGDTVSVDGWTGEWIVLGIDEDAAWLKCVSDGDHLTRYLSTLTLIRKAVKS